ncbi:hypothetical protein IP70_11165 [alpha proteobacterium AAP38]|nr:hypothetical protein IP70_11165 [alpha proteobacterium AAP38]
MTHANEKLEMLRRLLHRLATDGSVQAEVDEQLLRLVAEGAKGEELARTLIIAQAAVIAMAADSGGAVLPAADREASPPVDGDPPPEDAGADGDQDGHDPRPTPLAVVPRPVQPVSANAAPRVSKTSFIDALPEFSTDGPSPRSARSPESVPPASGIRYQPAAPQGAAPPPPAPPVPPPPSSSMAPSPGLPALAQRSPVSPPMPAFRMSLPVAKAGEPYKAKVPLPPSVPEPARSFMLSGVEAIGLSFDAASRTLSGTPTVAGDHEFPAGAVEDRIPSRRHNWICSLTVIADPKSLWKDLPSDRAALHWKDDEAVLLEQAGDHRIIGASKRGRSHANVGSFRDDDLLAEYTASGWSILAVADGAGSAPLSRRGSQIVCRTACERLRVLIDEHLAAGVETLICAWHAGGEGEAALRSRLYHCLIGAAFEAWHGIRKEAEEAGRPAREYATTLILALHRKTEAGHFAACFAIGDGGAGMLDLANGRLVPLTTPDSGEYAGQTRFLDGSEFLTVDAAKNNMARIHMGLVNELTGLVLMTDGVTDPMFETDERLAAFEVWKGFWEGQVAPAISGGNPDGGLLAWLDFWSRGNHDDRTILVLR